MTVDSYNIEFGYELLSAVPYPDGRVVDNWFGKKEFGGIENVFKNQGICIELMT